MEVSPMSGTTVACPLLIMQVAGSERCSVCRMRSDVATHDESGVCEHCRMEQEPPPNQLRRTRLMHEMTDADLADQVGVDRFTLLAWELGVEEVGDDDKLALARALRVSPFSLFPGSLS
jgi:DNA-binding XRE family transcriptional regulator